jgi:dienelactone hydrolase
LGWTFPRDLKGAAAFLRRRSDVDPHRIGGIGLSVGGEALLQTAAESDTYNAVVSEGAGARTHRELLASDKGSKWLELPGLLVTTAGTALFSNTAPPPSIKDLTPRISPTPVFFIYAGHGQGGEDLNPKYFAAAHAPKQIWKIPEASHTHGLSTRPEEYERRVVGFFDRNLR